MAGKRFEVERLLEDEVPFERGREDLSKADGGVNKNGNDALG